MSSTPKEVLKRIRNRVGVDSLFGSTSSPIDDEVLDGRMSKYFLHGYPVVPFSRNGEVTLDLIHKLSELSPTNGAILEDKKRMIMGGQWKVTKKKPQGWAEEEEIDDVSNEEKKRVQDWVRDTFGKYDAFNDEGELLVENLLRYGNGYLELQIHVGVQGVYGRIFNHDFHTGLYLDNDQMDTIMISPYWYTKYSGNEDHVYPLPVYPNVIEDKGVYKTLFHIKEQSPRRKKYGLSSWIRGLYSIYQEIQIGEFTVSQYANDWTPRVFIESFEGFGEEGDDEDGGDGPGGFMANIRKFFTRRGKLRSSFLFRNAPEGATPSQVHQFQSNSDYKGREVDTKISKQAIITAHRWHEALMESTPGKLGGENNFKQIFQVKYKTVIEPYEKVIVDLLNKVCEIVAGFQQDSIMDEYSLGLVNLFEDMLKEEIIAEKEAEGEGEKGGDVEPKNEK